MEEDDPRTTTPTPNLPIGCKPVYEVWMYASGPPGAKEYPYPPPPVVLGTDSPEWG